MDGHIKAELDDINKTVICIPFDPPEDGELSAPVMLPPEDISERDLPEGPELRFEEYRVAWNKCLARMKDIIHDLYTPCAQEVVEQTDPDALAREEVPGLPYKEVPVLTVIDTNLGSTFLDTVSGRLRSTNRKPRVANLFPTDAPNLVAGMRTIIASLIDPEDLDTAKRKPSSSTATYDIRYLVAWYKYALKKDPLTKPNLIIVLREFEQFDPIVMKDIFYIFASEIERLPVTFVLSLSTPSPDYLHSCYTRSTLALLRIHTVVVPSGPKVLETILLKTFFDVNFEPAITLGSAALEFIIDYFTRFNSSVDAILTAVQLIYLKHFSIEPLTLLVSKTPTTEILDRPTSKPFVKALQTRLQKCYDLTDAQRNAEPEALDGVLGLIRKSFRSAAQGVCVGFGVVHQLQLFFEQKGYAGFGWSSNPKKNGLLNAMVDAHKTGLEREVRRVGLLIGKSSPDELRSILGVLHKFFHVMPSDVRAAEREARSHIVSINSLQTLDSGIAVEFGKWLTEYLKDKLVEVEALDLWDIWYTGKTNPPSEHLNPSIRASVIAGLLRPFEFCTPPGPTEPPPEKPLWEHPDTSILFKRYLDSGKMINVYDWFEAFKTVLDTQRTELRTKEHIRKLAQTAPPLSLTKRGRGKKAADATRVLVPKPTEAEEEKWKVQVQARFMRALHELDHLGFIKHTGRKADHVLRTVFDVADAE